MFRHHHACVLHLVHIVYTAVVRILYYSCIVRARTIYSCSTYISYVGGIARATPASAPAYYNRSHYIWTFSIGSLYSSSSPRSQPISPATASAPAAVSVSAPYSGSSGGPPATCNPHRVLLSAYVPAMILGQPCTEIHRVGPEVSGWPSGFTKNPYRSPEVGPKSGPAPWVLPSPARPRPRAVR